MHEWLTHALTAFMGFFAIMNPISNTPIFLSLTEGDDPAVRNVVARRGIRLAFMIVLAFTIAGNAIFRVFGIGLPAFTIAGGLIVLLIGFHMVQGHASPVQHPVHSGGVITLDGELNKAVSPLAMPLLAGPGTIATAITFSTGSLDNLTTTLIAWLAICLVTYSCFNYSERLVSALGQQGMRVITRLMGLILAAIGVQMVIGAVAELVKAQT